MEDLNRKIVIPTDQEQPLPTDETKRLIGIREITGKIAKELQNDNFNKTYKHETNTK